MIKIYNVLKYLILFFLEYMVLVFFGYDNILLRVFYIYDYVYILS